MTEEITREIGGHKFRWLASYPKSGNTWVRLLLNAYLTGGSHPNYLSPPSSMSDLRVYDYQIVAPTELSKMDGYSVLWMRGAVLEHLRRKHGWGLTKTHHANFTFAGVELIPDAITDRAVYLVRDPRDVVVSFARHIDQPIDKVIDLLGKEGAVSQNTDCKSLFHILSTWSVHVNSWMSESQFPVMCVKYETLRKEPCEQFSKIARFVGLDVEPEQVERAVDLVGIDKLRAFEAKHGFKEAKNGVFFGDTGGWQQKLTTEQADRIVNDHHAVMEAMGYV